MSDYGHIGDAMVFLAVTAAFAVPTAVGAIIGLILALCGLPTAGIAIGAVGALVGVALAVRVAIS